MGKLQGNHLFHALLGESMLQDDKGNRHVGDLKAAGEGG